MKQEFRYSYNVIGFQGEDIAESIDRLAPGLGHVDFTDVLQALRDVRYGGGLTFELIPALPNILEDGPGLISLDDVARQAIDHMREVERRLARTRQEMHPG